MRARHANIGGPALVLMLIPGLLAGGVAVSLPSLVHTLDSSVPIILLLPLIGMMVVAWCLDTGDPVNEYLAVRSVQLLDAAAIAVLSGSFLVVGLADRLLIDSDTGFTFTRNLLGYLGLMLIGRQVVGRNLSVLLPLAFVLAVMLIGRYANGSSRWWAWPLAPPHLSHTWLFAGGLLVIGLFLTAARRLPPGRAE